MGAILVDGKVLMQDGKPILASGSGDQVDTPPVVGTGTIAFTNEPLEQQVFQRVGTSKIVAVSGTFTGDVSQVQARAVPVGTALSSTTVAWTDIPTDAAAGTFSGTLSVPQGGWYTWQVRDKIATNLAAIGARKWGVGVIIALIGQSNMANFPETVDNYPIGSPLTVAFHRDGTYGRIGKINDAAAPNTMYGSPGYALSNGQVPPDAPLDNGKSQVGDGFVFMGNLISAALNVPVCFIERAIGGTSIEWWLISANNKWPQFASAVAAAGGDYELVAWDQGENNAADGMPTATYETHLGAIDSQCRNMVPAYRKDSLHFAVISLGPVSLASSYSGGNDTNTGKIRAAQVHYANSTPGAFLLTSAHDAVTGDGVHRNGKSASKLGRREAQGILARFGIGPSTSGPRITSVTRAGNVLTATVTHAGGTMLKDGAGGTGTALKGFEYLNGSGGQIAITATAITGPNTIQLTLASGAAGTLSYAMHNAPHNANTSDSTTALDLASIVYDDTVYFRSTEGAVLQPLPPFAVS
jgi:hypothetical protein